MIFSVVAAKVLAIVAAFPDSTTTQCEVYFCIQSLSQSPTRIPHLPGFEVDTLHTNRKKRVLYMVHYSSIEDAVLVIPDVISRGKGEGRWIVVPRLGDWRCRTGWPGAERTWIKAQEWDIPQEGSAERERTND